MYRAIWIILGALSACAPGDIRDYDHVYFGVVDDDCGTRRLVARVVNGNFILNAPPMTGNVTPDGQITASGDQVMLDGRIAGKMFGYAMTLHIHDHQCNPDVTLAPEQTPAAKPDRKIDVPSLH